MGKNGGLLDLQFLPNEAEPVVGDLVLTSGHGGVLPNGIPVGRIAHRDGDEILVRPAVDLRHLGYVSIMVGGLDGIDNSNLDLGKFYTPLPEDGGSRLLEGLTRQENANERSARLF